MQRTLLCALGAALALAGCQDDGTAPPLVGDDGPLLAPLPLSDGAYWYAAQLFYAISVRSFQDSDGDGVGDLGGVTARLDYIRGLGVGAIVLDPIQPGSQHDGNRAVSDLLSVDPRLGGDAALAELVAALDARGMRLVLELPLNHTDDTHPWFAAAAATSTAAERAYYRFTTSSTACDDLRTPTVDPYHGERFRAIVTGATTVYHRFASTSPDLDLRHPEVWSAVAAAAEHWIGAGADGLLVPHPYAWVEDGARCDDEVASLALLAELRAVVAAADPEAIVIAGTDQIGGDYVPRPARVASYSGGAGEPRAHMAMAPHHGLGMHELMTRAVGSILWRSDWADLVTQVQRRDGARALVPTGHPDMPRLSQAVSNDDRAARMILGIALTVPATPWLFYGDEIGIGQGSSTPNDFRDLAIPPMPWSATAPHLGFSTVEPWLEAPALLPQRAVDSQDADEGSLLNFIRRMGDWRNRLAALNRGNFTTVAVSAGEGVDTPNDVLVWVRRHDDDAVVVVHNVSPIDSFTVRLGLEATGWQPGLALRNILDPEQELTPYAGPSQSYRLTVPRLSTIVLAPRDAVAAALGDTDESAP